MTREGILAHLVFLGKNIQKFEFNTAITSGLCDLCGLGIKKNWFNRD